MRRHYWLAVMVVVVASVAGQEESLTWWNIGKFLREIMDTGLGADKMQDYLSNGFEWQTREVDGVQRLRQMTKRVANLFKRNIDAVKELKQVIEEEYDNWQPRPLHQVNSSRLCCKADVPHQEGCGIAAPRGPPAERPLAVSPPARVVREMKRIKQDYPAAIVQYFAFNDGSIYMNPANFHTDFYDCNSYDPRLRYFFTQSKSPEPRVVVVVVDAAPAYSRREKYRLLENLVIRTFNALSQLDQVGLCLPGPNGCQTEQNSHHSRSGWPEQDLPLGRQSLLGRMVTLTEWHKHRLYEFLEDWLRGLTQQVFPNHTAALAAGIQVFNTTIKRPFTHTSAEEPHKVLVYVTTQSGWQSWEEDPSLQDIVNSAVTNNISLVINPIQEGAEGVKNGTLMYDNNITVKLAPFPDEATFNTSQTSVTSFGETNTDRPVIPIPYWDGFGKGYILTVCLPLVSHGKFVGTTCTDDSIIHLLTDTSINDIENAYVFLVNSLGNTLMHPLLPSPHSLKQDPVAVTIDKLEHRAHHPTLERIMSQQADQEDVKNGVRVVALGRPSGTDLPTVVRRHHAHLRFLWSPIPLTDLTIVLVLPLKNGKVSSTLYRCYNATSCETPDFHYHRPDNTTELREFCYFFGTKVIKGEGLVKFAPNCFIDVLSYLRHGEAGNKRITKIYSIFNGTSPYDELLKNDFQPSVRLVEEAQRVWKSAKNLSDYIGLQFIGTADGVFLHYPGTELKPSFDHRNRPWYQLAVSTREKSSISMTVPYCDEFGAGMVYTLVRTLVTPAGSPGAVMAGDFTLQYIMNHLHQQLPTCTKRTCILVDETGYVVLKSDWDQNKTVPSKCANNTGIMAAHIVQLAPDLARDMIASRVLRRRGCHDFEHGITIYYWWLGLTGQSSQHTGDTYQVYKIPFTNLFLVVRTKSLQSDRCNCNSSKDIKIMECDNTCAQECECPCVAGTHTQPCNNPQDDVHSVKWSLPACQPSGLTLVIAKHHTEEDLKDKLPCHTKKCNYNNRINCNNVMRCMWVENKCKNVDDLIRGDAIGS